MADRFVWRLTWGDDALGAVCTDMTARMVGAARTLLAESRGEPLAAGNGLSFTKSSVTALLWSRDSAPAEVPEHTYAVSQVPLPP